MTVVPSATAAMTAMIGISSINVGIISPSIVIPCRLNGKEVKVKDGEKLTKPADPTKEGYKFLGWFVGDKKFDFDTPITKELNGIKIEARFEKIKDEPQQPNKGGAVQTGDTTNIALWIACLGIAGAAVAVTLRSRRKRS